MVCEGQKCNETYVPTLVILLGPGEASILLLIRFGSESLCIVQYM